MCSSSQRVGCSARTGLTLHAAVYVRMTPDADNTVSSMSAYSCQGHAHLKLVVILQTELYEALEMTKRLYSYALYMRQCTTVY
jgi:hypothetical protein